jgi:arylsulfatase A-like enzyme
MSWYAPGPDPTRRSVARRRRFFALAAVAVGALAFAGCDQPVPDADLTSLHMVDDYVETVDRAVVSRAVATLEWDGVVRGIRPTMGWAGSETNERVGVDYAWVVAHEAHLVADVRGGRPLWLEFRAWPFTWDGAPRQRVDVEVNGHLVDSVRMRSGIDEYRVALPERITHPGRNRIRFRFGYAESPERVDPTSRDRRTLAAAFDWVRVRPRWTRAPAQDDAPLSVENGALELDPGVALTRHVVVDGDAVVEVATAAESAPVEVWVRQPKVGFRRLGTAAAGTTRRFGLHEWRGTSVELTVTGRGVRTPVAIDAWKLYASSPAERPANVVVVVVDTLRADHVGCYGGTVETPVLDDLAARGVRFDDARSHAPITGPSHASLFTSRFPLEHGVHTNAQIFSPRGVSLPRAMRESGRITAAFVSLGVLNAGFGFGAGFDTYGDRFERDWMKDAGEINDEVVRWLDEAGSRPFFLFVHYSEPHEPHALPETEVPTIRVSQAGVARATVRADGRGHRVPITVPPGDSEVALELASGSSIRGFRVAAVRVRGANVDVEIGTGWRTTRDGRARAKTDLPATFRLRSTLETTVHAELDIQIGEVLGVGQIRHRYRQEVAAVDTKLGELLHEMDDRRLLDDAVVVVTSDHGEGLGDHGLVAHIEQLYDSLLSVPLIMWAPGRLPEGAVVSEAVGLVDVYPTLAELLDLPMPEAVVGRSLVDVAHGRPSAPRGVPLLAETYRPEAPRDKRALVLDGWKLIRTLHPRSAAVDELYDLRADPDEANDVIGSASDVASRLAGELDSVVATLGQGVKPRDARLTEQEKANLRALGYMAE